MTVQAPQHDSTDTYAEAVHLFGSGDYERSAALLAEMLQEDPTSDRWNDWATAKFLAGRVAEAEGGYRRALELNPGYVPAIANLGALLAGEGRYAEALPLLEFSVTRTQSSQQETLGELIENCKAASARARAESKPEWMHSIHSLVTSLALQTTSLDRLLLRLALLEPDLRESHARILTALRDIRQALRERQANGQAPAQPSRNAAVPGKM